MTTRNQIRARDAFIVALLAGAFYLVFAFVEIVVEDRKQREAEAAAASQPMREEDFWPEPPHGPDMWGQMRGLVANRPEMYREDL